MEESVPFVPYMRRELPWGETGEQAESRISKLKLRAQWDQRGRQIKAATGCHLNEARYAALLEYPPASGDSLVDGIEDRCLTNDDLGFVEKAREGLQMRLPMRASVEKELDWVGSNLHCSRPDVQSAPSLTAICFIIDARTDVKVRAAFWNTMWSKRLSPGERKPRASALKEDREGEKEAGSEADEAERMLRLFG
jgi:hypothetical protein